MDGIDCNPHTASFEMLYTRDKFSKHNGVQYVHLVYSLSPVESEKLDVERVLLNAKLLVERTDNFKGHQTIICVHDDKKHKHAHIVINAVNFQTGKKVRWYRTDLRCFKDRLIELSREQGLEVPVNLKYTIGLGSMFGIYLAAGPDFFFNFKDIDVANFEAKKTQVAVNLGAGVKLLKKLQIGITYQIPMGDSFEWKDVTDTALNYGAKTKTWQVSAAYIF